MAYLGDESLKDIADEEILARSVTNPNLFAILVERYEEAFLRKVRRILGGREEAIDVVQEAFTKIYLNAHRFEKQEGAQFSSWGYKILLNTTFTYYKKLQKKDGAGVRLEDEIWALFPDESLRGAEKGEVRDLVASIISRMPESLAKVLTLHFLEDKPQKEIADEEGVSVSAIKTRIHRAKKEFKKISNTIA